MPLKLSAFPKCYIDEIAGRRTMSVFDWIEMARALDADGLEMYDGFFTSLDDAYSTAWARRSRRPGSPCRCSAARPTSPTPTPTAASGPSSARRS